MRGERGVVTAAVFGMKHETQIEYFRFQLGVFAVLAEHIENIFGGRKFFARFMNEQRRVRMVILICFLAVNGEQRELSDQLH